MPRPVATLFRRQAAAFVCCLCGSLLAAGGDERQMPREWSAPSDMSEQSGRSDERDEPEDVEGFETDRDSFTPSTTTVRFGRVVGESSYSFVDNRTTAETHSFPELLLRLGIDERLELRFGANYEVGGEGASVSGGTGAEDRESSGLEEESEVLYGIKFQLSEQQGWIAASSLIVQGHTPTSGPDPATALNLGYVLGWELPREWKVDSAVRYFSDKAEEDRFSTWAPSTVLRKSVGEQWNLHVEYFGIYSQDREEDFSRHFISPGIHYLVQRNLEIGVRVGWGLNEDSANFFSNAGIGWQF